MYRSESWQSWSKSASQENIVKYENDTENYEIIDLDTEIFVNMQHSNSKAPSEYADKRCFGADTDSQVSTEAQMIAATSHVHINRRTKINNPRPKDSQSVRDQKHSRMDHRTPPRFSSQNYPPNHCSRNDYESESKMRDSVPFQGPPVDRSLKPEKLCQGKVDSSVTTHSNNGRPITEGSKKRERIVNIQSNTAPAKLIAEESYEKEEDTDTTMVSREVIDVHHPKDFLKQQPELFDPTQISYTDNLRKKQTWEDIDPQTTLEWRNVAEEENKAQMTDLKTKWCAVKEDLESQLKAQKTEKKPAPLAKMMPTEGYLTASSNKTHSNNDVNESRGMEKEIVLSENLDTSSVHHVKITIPNKISENVSRKAKISENVPMKNKEQLEKTEDAGTSTRQHVTDNSTHKVSQYKLLKTEDQVEQTGDIMPSTTQHITSTASQKISKYLLKKTKDQVGQKEDSLAYTKQHVPSTTTCKISKHITKKTEEQEEHKKGSGISTQGASIAISTQPISESMSLYRQEEEQCYETIINLLQNLLNKQESIHPQDEHITFLMSLAPYIKHVPESQQLSMRVSVMNTILSFIPSLSDSYHSLTTTQSPFTEYPQRQATAPHPSNTL
ncbi:cytokine-dependent hematopoietic cell linker isoform X2 [Aquarana catesbeiana]|uniref:cytokine-dependent hematopoietic cell linker isoform X2 n=1 Tax=Aquarana catesbeiana TaxID=8400 RepID=UPI003CC971BF